MTEEFDADESETTIDEQDVLHYDTIEDILQDAEEAADYAEERGYWAEHDGIMSVVNELRSEMYD